MATYPVNPATGATSYQSYLRSQQYLPSGTTYDQFMTSMNGAPSYWQQVLRTGSVVPKTTTSVAKTTPKPAVKTSKPSKPSANTPSMSPDYYKQAEAIYSPFRDKAMASLKARLADAGLLKSTGAIGAMTDAESEWASMLKQWADERFRNDRDFSENQRQFGLNFDEAVRQYGLNNIKDWYELLTSGALAREQISGGTEGIRYPTDPSWLTGNLWNQFIAPRSASGPTGDPNVQYAPSHTEDRRNFARDQENRIAADADADRALQREIFNFNKSQADSEAAGDPWQDITAFAVANRQLTPETGQLFPTDVLAAVQGQYGINVLDEARAGNQQALAVLKLLYPESWEEKLNGIAADDSRRSGSGVFGRATDNPLGSFAAGSPASRVFQGASPPQGTGEQIGRALVTSNPLSWLGGYNRWAVNEALPWVKNFFTGK